MLSPLEETATMTTLACPPTPWAQISSPAGARRWPRCWATTVSGRV